MVDEFEMRRRNKALGKMYDDVSERYVNRLKELEAKNDEELREGVRDIINSWKGTQ